MQDLSKHFRFSFSPWSAKCQIVLMIDFRPQILTPSSSGGTCWNDLHTAETVTFHVQIPYHFKNITLYLITRHQMQNFQDTKMRPTADSKSTPPFS